MSLRTELTLVFSLARHGAPDKEALNAIADTQTRVNAFLDQYDAAAKKAIEQKAEADRQAQEEANKQGDDAGAGEAGDATGETPTDEAPPLDAAAVAESAPPAPAPPKVVPAVVKHGINSPEAQAQRDAREAKRKAGEAGKTPGS